ncbi:MAG: DUF3810 domain-containing protein [Oscillospiraceae bacterium]|nr:DUF3810 domain-containing protein [Oscillospiraceae bacterium]
MNLTRLKIYISKNKIVTVSFIIGIISVIVWRLSIIYVGIADFCTETISFAMRFILTKATYFIPFSFAEFMLYSLVPLFIFIFIKLVTSKKPKKSLFKLFSGALAVWGIFMFLFTFTLGVCYGTTTVNQKIGFERRLLEAEDLASALEILIAETNEISGNIKYIYSDTGSTVMPYNLNEMNKKLNEAYKNMLSRHDLFIRIYTKVKPVILSEQMSKMHITGIYAFFTGEANLNIDFPDYILPFTAAHEMAHLMGVGREDESNFVAFLVCIHSDDDYIRYSGLVNMMEYIGNALYGADKDKYDEIIKDTPEIVTQEMAAYSRFFEKYRNTKISKVANAVNNSYLKIQGQEQGAKSYGFVVDLATVYLLDLYEKK